MNELDFDDLAQRGTQMLSRGVTTREAFRQVAKLAFERGQRMNREERPEKGPDHDVLPRLHA